MATADYNSPYTGAQLDEVIRKITSNDIHTYTELFRNPAGTTGGIPINTFQAGPDGLRTGTYEILWGGQGALVDHANLSMIVIENLSTSARGPGSFNFTDTSGTMILSVDTAYYDPTTQKIEVFRRDLDLNTNTEVANWSVEIFVVSRRDTLR